MTMRSSAVIAILFAAIPTGVQAEALSGYAFGKSYVIVVTGDDLKKRPTWDQSAENPPLSARKALKLATDYPRRLIPGHADWEWHLNYLGLRQTEGMWYWLAHFEALPKNANFEGRAPNLYVAVLMDGTIVKPEIADTTGR
jgi:hypothetical protein